MQQRATCPETTSTTNPIAEEQAGHWPGSTEGKSSTVTWRAQHLHIHCIVHSFWPNWEWIGDHSILRSSKGEKSGGPLTRLQHNGLMFGSAGICADCCMEFAVEFDGGTHKSTERPRSLKTPSRTLESMCPRMSCAQKGQRTWEDKRVALVLLQSAHFSTTDGVRYLGT